MNYFIKITYSLLTCRICNDKLRTNALFSFFFIPFLGDNGTCSSYFCTYMVKPCSCILPCKVYRRDKPYHTWNMRGSNSKHLIPKNITPLLGHPKRTLSLIFISIIRCPHLIIITFWFSITPLKEHHSLKSSSKFNIKIISYKNMIHYKKF